MTPLPHIHRIRPRTGTGPGPGRGVRSDVGSVSAFTVILTLAVVMFAGLVLDAGLAVATKVRAVSVAQSAARAGARELDVAALRTTGTIRLDRAQAQATARTWITRSGMTGTVAVTADTVTVTVTTTRRTQLLQLIGVRSLPVAATANANAVQS